MTILALRLSDCVAIGFQVVPGYSTRIVGLENGREARNVNWTKAKRRFSATYQNFSREDFDELLAMFHCADGSGSAFLFKDWTDYQVTLGALGNTPGANQTPVQLVKVYTAGAATRTRTITKPVTGTTTVYQDDGAGNFVAKAGTVDTNTGLFTPTANWAAGRALKATFQFDVAVRFVSDELPSTFEATQNYITTSCDLIEIFGE